MFSARVKCDAADALQFDRLQPDSISMSRAPLGQVLRIKCNLFPRSDLQGDKLVLPTSFFKTLSDKNVSFPYTFKVTSEKSNKSCFAGVLEFSADSGIAFASEWFLNQLNVDAGATVQVVSHRVPHGEYVQLEPNVDFDIASSKFALESLISQQFTCLTKDTILTFPQSTLGVASERSNQTIEFKIVQVRPPDYGGILVLDTDLAVDFIIKSTSAPEPMTDGFGSSATTQTDITSSSTCTKSVNGNAIPSESHIFELCPGIEITGQVPRGQYVYFRCDSVDVDSLLTLRSQSGDADLFVTQFRTDNDLLPSRGDFDLASVLAQAVDEIELDSDSNSVRVAVYGYTDAQFSLKLDAKPAPAVANLTSMSSEMMLCENCGKSVPSLAISRHLPNCRRLIAKCTECSLRIENTDVEKHKHQQMFHLNVDCDGCHSFTAHGELELAKHQMMNCSSRRLLCMFCSLFVLHSEFDQHQAACGSRSVECGYCGERLLQRDRTEHLLVVHGVEHENADEVSTELTRCEVPAHQISTAAGNAAIQRLQMAQNTVQAVHVASSVNAPLNRGDGEPFQKSAKVSSTTSNVNPALSNEVKLDMPLTRAQNFRTADEILQSSARQVNQSFAASMHVADSSQSKLPLNFRSADDILASKAASLDAELAAKRQQLQHQLQRAQAPPSLHTTTKVHAVTKPSPQHQRTLIRVRLPDAAAPPLQREFGVDEAFSSVLNWVCASLNDRSPEHIRLASAGPPPRVFDNTDTALTLKMCGLVPQGALRLVASSSTE